MIVLIRRQVSSLQYWNLCNLQFTNISIRESHGFTETTNNAFLMRRIIKKSNFIQVYKKNTINSINIANLRKKITTEKLCFNFKIKWNYSVSWFQIPCPLVYSRLEFFNFQFYLLICPVFYFLLSVLSWFYGYGLFSLVLY